MEPGFFGSRYFLVSAIVAVGILAGAGAAYRLDAVAFRADWYDGCAAPSLAGSALAVEPETSVDDDGERRTVVYRFPASAFASGATELCSSFGDIDVEPSPDDAVEVRFVITSRFAEAVEETEVVAELRDDAGVVTVGAWVARIGQARGAFSTDGANIRLVVLVPDALDWDVVAHTSAGDLHATDVRASSLDLESNFGRVVATGIDLAGDARLHTSAGDVVLALASVQSGAIDATSSFGDVEVELPARADVGYDVVGETDFGEVTIRIGPTDHYESEGGHAAGERESARSAGFDSKPTKLTVAGSSSAGDVRIATTTQTT